MKKITLMILIFFITVSLFAVEAGIEYGYDVFGSESLSRANIITTHNINNHSGIRFGVGVLSNGFDIKGNNIIIGYEEKFTFFETTLGLITDGFITLNPGYNGFGLRFAGEFGWLITQMSEFNIGLSANMIVAKDLGTLTWKFTPYLGISGRF